MLQGFKDFIMRGNVIDLAVAVVIGGAFTAIVTAFTDNLINPAIAALGSTEVAGLGYQITSNPETFMDFGKVITAALNFLIIAAVVYFVLVLPMNKLKALQDACKKVEAEEDVPVPIEVELLSEIRDLLKEGNPSAGATKNPF